VAFRYALAGCMFAWPEAHISISSPCQVSCAALNASIDYQITNDTSTARPGEAFCNVGTFDSTTINRCAFCYSFIPQQLFLANCKALTVFPLGLFCVTDASQSCKHYISPVSNHPFRASHSFPLLPPSSMRRSLQALPRHRTTPAQAPDCMAGNWPSLSHYPL